MSDTVDQDKIRQPIDTLEHTRLKKILSACMDWEDDWSDFEREFITNMVELEEALGLMLRLSNNQWEILFQLEGKYG